MTYRIVHITRYKYHESVNLCHNEARLIPRSNAWQVCKFSQVNIEPLPEEYSEREDFFGNRVSYFAIQHPHEQLMVKVISEVQKTAIETQTDLFGGISWERAKLELLSNKPDLLDARQFVLESPMLASSLTVEQYARVSFTAGRPLLEATHDLMRRIHKDFDYVPKFTTIATPLSEIMRQRKGVCQDFAHLSIACLRSMGLPARYISGYLETVPAPGTERLTGADASHAWFSVFVPGSGWVDFDPTNNLIPSTKHITLAWGRDYSDVSPLKGVVFSAGKHALSVSVDVQRISG
ncbi:MAG: transglutaminase family protein [Bacteroidota bacterium]